ncbi:MAG: AI-2E family transporter [Gemmataceae bacterium]
MSDSIYPGKTRWQDAEALRPLAILVIIACGSWWMLGQLAVVLRPLLVAIFLAYVLLPWFNKLRKKMPGPIAIVSLAGLAALALAVMAVISYSSLLGMQDEFPRIEKRSMEMARGLSTFIQKNMPWLVPDAPPEPAPPAIPVPVANPEAADEKSATAEAAPKVYRPEVVFVQRLTSLAKVEAGRAATVAATGISEAIVAGLYLFFLLLEASRFPLRVKDAYESQRADQILSVFERINLAINGYLRAKVYSGLWLAFGVAIVLWMFDVKFVFLWAVFTFLCNFIPYVGSFLACVLPAAFALVLLDSPTRALTFCGLLLAVHLFMGFVVEPYLVGKALGLSPLVILVALALWGSIWGLPGMFLAVPLTMVVLIVLDNIPSTRSFARLFLT